MASAPAAEASLTVDVASTCGRCRARVGSLLFSWGHLGATLCRDAKGQARLQQGVPQVTVLLGEPRTCCFPCLGNLLSAGKSHRAVSQHAGLGKPGIAARSTGDVMGWPGNPLGGPRLCRTGSATSGHSEELWGGCGPLAGEPLELCLCRMPGSRACPPQRGGSVRTRVNITSHGFTSPRFSPCSL